MAKWLAGLCAIWTVLVSMGFSQRESYSYERVRTGALKGKLLVQWLEPDLFLFIPDSQVPLMFTRASGETITPGRMITDGGTIPRSVWILRNYSPWGFAPAFIVHDWLFTSRQCRSAGFEKYSVEDAGLIMAEVMKSMIVAKRIDASGMTVTAMYLAVTSPPARKSWDDGKCNPPPAGFKGTPITQFELSF